MKDLSLPVFRPHPLVRGPHLQTVVGAYLFGDLAPYNATQRRVPLDDGDVIVLHDDRPDVWREGDPAALLIHGVGSCSRSSYVSRLAVKLNRVGVRTFRMDLRSCGAGFGLARRLCHAGRSEDALAALRRVIELCPDSPLTMIGLSMGGNIVLKMAGELAGEAPPELRQVISVSPPIDVIQASENLQRGLNRLYDWSFVRRLMQQTRLLAKHGVCNSVLSLPREPRRLLEFDELITAPLSGYASAKEYYTAVSSAPLLPRIRVPTLVLTAADDPVIPVAMFERADYSDSTHLHIACSGGHLGFVGAAGADPDCRWLEWRIVHLIAGEAEPQRSLARQEARLVKRTQLMGGEA